MPDETKETGMWYYRDACRAAALDDDNCADQHEGLASLDDTARYRTRARALRALADLCEDATALIRQSSTTHGRTKRAWALLTALAAGYREGR